MKWGCVFWEFAKKKLVTRKDKIKIIMTKRYGYATFLPLMLSVGGEERCEVLACFHVVVKMYRYSLEERVFIVETYGLLVPLRIARGGLLSSLVAETRRRNTAFNF
jgi:hypothetical protein